MCLQLNANTNQVNFLVKLECVHEPEKFTQVQANSLVTSACTRLCNFLHKIYSRNVT